MTRWPSFPVDMGRIIVLAGNIMAFLVSVLFLVSSEIQVSKNCVLGGENTSWGFGYVQYLCPYETTAEVLTRHRPIFFLD